MRLLLAVDSVMTTEMIMKAVTSRPWPRGTRARVISVVEDDAIPAEVWRDAGYSADAMRQEMRRRQGTCFLLIPNLEAALGGFPRSQRSRTGRPTISATRASASSHTSGCSTTAAESGHPPLRMSSLPPSLPTLGDPPMAFNTSSAFCNRPSRSTGAVVRSMAGGQRPADLAQDVFERGGREAALQRGDELIEQSVVGFGEKALGFRRQLVGEMRLARAALHAALPDEAVAFEREQVGADGVVRQFEALTPTR